MPHTSRSNCTWLAAASGHLVLPRRWALGEPCRLPTRAVLAMHLQMFEPSLDWPRRLLIQRLRAEVSMETGPMSVHSPQSTQSIASSTNIQFYSIKSLSFSIKHWPTCLVWRLLGLARIGMWPGAGLSLLHQLPFFFAGLDLFAGHDHALIHLAACNRQKKIANQQEGPMAWRSFLLSKNKNNAYFEW